MEWDQSARGAGRRLNPRLDGVATLRHETRLRGFGTRGQIVTLQKNSV